MSENNETPNEFADQPAANGGEDVPPTKDPSAVADAVKKAIVEQGVSQVTLLPCPCGVANVNLMIDLPPGVKVGRATCGACGTWGVDFLAPRSNDKEIMGVAAAKAWNEAPRPV